MNVYLRFLLSLLLLCAALPASAVAVHAIEREIFDRSRTTVDLRGSFEYAVVPRADADPEAVWAMPDAAFRPTMPGQRLQIPEGQMMLLRVELHVDQVRDPDYLRLPSARLDTVRYWARSEGMAWHGSQAGDRVPTGRWPFAAPAPAFELPDSNNRIQLVLAVEHRGSLNVPIEWVPDHVFRADFLNHGFAFGALTGLVLALAGVCGMAAVLYRRMEFATLSLYTLLTGLSAMASNGYAGIYLWPQWPDWNDPSKTFLATLVTAALVPVLARVLRVDVHRRRDWLLSLAWGGAGLAYAFLQLSLLPPEWRLPGNMAYALLSLGFAGTLAMRGVLRGDAMSRWALLAVCFVVVATVLGYADLLGRVNELPLLVSNAALRLVFITLLLGVAVQRHRFGREVISRSMGGAARDALTGLRNRAGLQQDIARSALLAGNSGADAGIILCDLRSIGTIRSEYGEELAERILVRIAFVLQRGLRSDQVLLARLGYARFGAVVLGATSDEELQAMATRILAQLLGQTDLPDAVRELKLRIYMARQPLAQLQLEPVEALANKDMTAGGNDSRTIRWL